jgi:hypothetical protein
MSAKRIHTITGCWPFWVYRNPYDRTCPICGRRQNVFQNVYRREDDSGDYWAGHGHWEDMYPDPTFPTSEKE